MITVGMLELKHRLSEFIRAVTAGKNVLVTNRGEVVAELTAPGRNAFDPGVPPGLAALARRGLVTLGAGQGDASALYRPLPRRTRARHIARELLEQERGAR